MTEEALKEQLKRAEKTVEELKEKLQYGVVLGNFPKNMANVSKKDRVQLERRFIGKLINYINFEDIREKVVGYGISWRRFCDKKHQMIWRALETVSVPGSRERMDILEKEMLAEAREKAKADKNNPFQNKDVLEDGTHILWGLPGTAAYKQYHKAMVDGSMNGVFWLERGLEAAGALTAIGRSIDRHRGQGVFARAV